MEGFLSAFNYNAYGATNLDDIPSLIFTSDDQIPMKLAERLRPNPPPVEVNAEINTSSVTSEGMHNKKVKELFEQMETKVFHGKPKMYQVFKKFDQDNDGFVSYDDFAQCLNMIKVQASKDELAAMVKLVDKKGKGYLDFSDFSQVFRPDMSEQLVEVERKDTNYPNLLPSKDLNKSLIDKQSAIQEAVKQIRKGFQPDLDASKSILSHLLELVAPTRFSAKPDFGSTFLNFQQSPGDPGFVSEQ